MERLTANTVVVEVGRLCNRKCKHCLRGPMEDATVNIEHAKQFLAQFSYISCITFTGGEPTLYAKEIVELIDFIVNEGIEVYSFYVASNGQTYSHELMSGLIKLYAHTMEYGDGECTAYDVSSDQFHEPNPSVIRRLQAFSFFQQRSNIPQHGIISEGYAEENNIGYRYLNHNKKFYVNVCEYDGGDVEYEVDLVYLNALGYLYADCDYSYATQRNIEAKHCTETSIIDILKNEMFADIHY